MKIDGDAANNKILAKYRAEDKVEGNTNRLITLYTSAQSDKTAVESRIANIMNSQKYQDALTNSRATITPESGTAAIKMRDDAKEVLRGLDESFKTLRETTDNTIKFMEERLSAKNVPLPAKKPKGSDAPPALPPGAKLD
jgi:hypothetical protein